MTRSCSTVVAGTLELSRQELLNYVSEYIRVEYVPAECRNAVELDDDDAASSLFQVRLTNVGLRTVVGGDWTLYFNHAADLNHMLGGGDDGDLVVRHVDGWLFTLTLRRGRELRPLRDITMRRPLRLQSRSYAFPRWYGRVTVTAEKLYTCA